MATFKALIEVEVEEAVESKFQPPRIQALAYMRVKVIEIIINVPKIAASLDVRRKVTLFCPVVVYRLL